MAKKTLLESSEKLKEICEALKEETLTPARKEADEIIESAKDEASQIILQAKQQAEALLQESRTQIEKERAAFHSSLRQAKQQAVESLRQDIERQFIHHHLLEKIEKEMAKPEILAQLLHNMIKAIEKEGLKANLQASIAKSVSPKEVARLLAEDMKEQMEKGVLSTGDFAGGIRIKLEGKNMVFDMTSETVNHLLAKFIGKEFRELVFEPSETQL